MSRNNEFSEGFGLSRSEEAEIHGKAIANHLLDSVASIMGHQDWEHARLSARNEQDKQFADRYFGGPGTVKWDQDRDSNYLEIRHPSGWMAIHHGPRTDISHVETPGVVHDTWGYSDPSRHGMFSPMKPEEWPSGEQVRSDLNDWVKEHGAEYEENALGRRGSR